MFELKIADALVLEQACRTGHTNPARRCMVCIASHAAKGDASAWLTPDISYDKRSPAGWVSSLVPRACVFRSLHSIDEGQLLFCC